MQRWKWKIFRDVYIPFFNKKNCRNDFPYFLMQLLLLNILINANITQSYFNSKMIYFKCYHFCFITFAFFEMQSKYQKFNNQNNFEVYDHKYHSQYC